MACPYTATHFRKRENPSLPMTQFPQKLSIRYQTSNHTYLNCVLLFGKPLINNSDADNVNIQSIGVIRNESTHTN